jgi:hypothetical protein
VYARVEQGFGVSAKIGVSPPSLTSFKSYGSKTILDIVLDIILDSVFDILDTVLDTLLDILDAMLDIEFGILDTALDVVLDIKILATTRHLLDRVLA